MSALNEYLAYFTDLTESLITPFDKQTSTVFYFGVNVSCNGLIKISFV